MQEYMTFGGTQYPLGFQTTYGKQVAELVANSFSGYIQGGLKANGPIWSLTLKRLQVFSQARFLFQRMGNGRPQDMFFESSLRILEEPWTGGVTGDLLARMILDADFAGNHYSVRYDNELIRLETRAWAEIQAGTLTVEAAQAVQTAITAHAAATGQDRYEIEAALKKTVRHPEPSGD
jgi:hypothetical protein